jgi:hypothetical protein
MLFRDRAKKLCYPAFFGTLFLGQNARDIVWRSRGPFSREDLGNPRPPTTHLFERELDVPVDVVFSVEHPGIGGIGP